MKLVGHRLSKKSSSSGDQRRKESTRLDLVSARGVAAEVLGCPALRGHVGPEHEAHVTATPITNTFAPGLMCT